MRWPRSVRGSIAAIGILAVLSVGAVSTSPTEAAWSKPEYAKSDTVSAASLSTPMVTNCTATGINILGLGTITGISFTWQSTAPPAYQVHKLNNALGTAVPSVSGPDANGRYTYSVTYDQGLLTIVLGLLGSSVNIDVYTAAGNNWITPSTRWVASKSLLGNPTCIKQS